MRTRKRDQNNLFSLQRVTTPPRKMTRTTSVDRTGEFKELVTAKAKQVGQPPRTPTRTTSRTTDAWTLQAQQVATNLRSFDNFLTSIRRAYLDLGASQFSHSATQGGQRGQVDSTTKEGLLEQWQGVKWLSDKERDEIDFSVKVALRKSVDRVRQLEQLEQGQLPTHTYWRTVN